MGRTSNAAKDRWNAAHYTQIKVSVPPEIAAAFKAACAADGVSMACDLSAYMAGRGESVPAGKRPKPNPTETRPNRRKLTVTLIRTLEQMRDAEETYRDNIPENLQGSARYEAAEQSVSAIEDAIEILSDAY
jgi:hypothetical protein